MAKVLLTKTTWTAIHAAGSTERIQVMAGRIFVADSATPGEDDYHSYSAGTVIDMTAAKWAQAQDAAAYVIRSTI